MLVELGAKSRVGMGHLSALSIEHLSKVIYEHFSESPRYTQTICAIISVTRLGDLLDFVLVFKAFGNN